MDPEVVDEKFFSLLRKVSKGKIPVQNLIDYMQKVEEFCNEEGIELSEFLEEVFQDVICEEVHEIINDSEWRSDAVGKKCVVSPEVDFIRFSQRSTKTPSSCLPRIRIHQLRF